MTEPFKNRNYWKARLRPGVRFDRRLPQALGNEVFKIQPHDLPMKFIKATEIWLSDKRKPSHQSRWKRLLENEPVYLFAEILSFSVEEQEQDFAEALEESEGAVFEVIKSLKTRTDDWRERLNSIQDASLNNKLKEFGNQESLYREVKYKSLDKTGKSETKKAEFSSLRIARQSLRNIKLYHSFLVHWLKF